MAKRYKSRNPAGVPSRVICPDLQRVARWRQLIREYPGGLMSRSEAARVLGVGHQRLEAWLLTDVPIEPIYISKDEPAMVSVDQVMEFLEILQNTGFVMRNGKRIYASNLADAPF